MESDSWTIQPLDPDGQPGWRYFNLLLDSRRLGFRRVADKLLDDLDYQGFIAMKRTCKLIYSSINQSHFEAVSSSVIPYSKIGNKIDDL